MPHRTASSIIAEQRLVTASAEATVREAARLMKESRIGALLVVDSGRLAGIFTERDALFRVIAAGLDPDRTRVAEVMTREPQVIGPERSFGHALHLMYEGGFRHVPVVENGKPVGVVSSRDALAPELREFLSELDARARIGEILG
jgi:CBS domain-containing protein